MAMKEKNFKLHVDVDKQDYPFSITWRELDAFGTKELEYTEILTSGRGVYLDELFEEVESRYDLAICYVDVGELEKYMDDSYRVLDIPDRKLSTTVNCGPCGWRLEVYTDDDGASGYGENAMVGYWYGTREECEAKDPKEVRLRQIATSSLS